MKNNLKAIGFIPLRKGSKGIKNKNKIPILGRPLFSYVLTEAIFSSLDRIYVYTDDLEIINFINNEYHWTEKVVCIKRPENTATDNASTEFALERFLKSTNISFKYLCLLQATSPLTSREDIEKALILLNDKLDSVLSVVNVKRFLWNKDGTPINYDYKKRPLRQYFEGIYVENGAIYVTKRENILRSKCRISGKIGLYLMPEDSYFELDDKQDLIILEKLLEQRLLSKKKQLDPIKTIVLDLDGVLTNGTVIYDNAGNARIFSVLDGMGIEFAKREGLGIFILSSENSVDIKKRADKLEIKYFGGVKDKYAFLDYLLMTNKINRSQVAYIGDDVNDISNILSCHLGIVPTSAPSYIKNISDLVIPGTSGIDFVRNCMEYIIKYNKRRF